MRRESIPSPDKQDSPVGASIESSPSPASEAVVATAEAGQRAAPWLEQTLAAQVLAFKRLTDLLQASLGRLDGSAEAAAPARSTRHAARRRAGRRGALQRDLARHAALSAAVAAEETMDLLWPPSTPRTMGMQPAWSAEPAPLGDELSRRGSAFGCPGYKAPTRRPGHETARPLPGGCGVGSALSGRHGSRHARCHLRWLALSRGRHRCPGRSGAAGA